MDPADLRYDQVYICNKRPFPERLTYGGLVGGHHFFHGFSGGYYFLSSEIREHIHPVDGEVKIMEAQAFQVGGDHYKSCAIQPIEYIHKNGLGYFEGNVVKYITRHKQKNGKQDLLKARHYIDLLIELEYGKDE